MKAIKPFLIEDTDACQQHIDAPFEPEAGSCERGFSAKKPGDNHSIVDQILGPETSVAQFPTPTKKAIYVTDRRRAIQHALIELHHEATDLGMGLTGHLAAAAAEAAADEC